MQSDTAIPEAETGALALCVRHRGKMHTACLLPDSAWLTFASGAAFRLPYRIINGTAYVPGIHEIESFEFTPPHA